MTHQGVKQYEKGDYSGALEYWTKSTKLGSVDAHYLLAVLYDGGEGVAKDEEKVIRYLEEAAIGGHPLARYNPGITDLNNGNIERAVKHWIIAATQGDEYSMKSLMIAFKKWYVSKDDLAATLRAHHAAVDATKSPQREGSRIS